MSDQVVTNFASAPLMFNNVSEPTAPNYPAGYFTFRIEKNPCYNPSAVLDLNGYSTTPQIDFKLKVDTTTARGASIDELKASGRPYSYDPYNAGHGTMQFVLNGKFYRIPDVWFAVNINGYVCLYSNWKDYGWVSADYKQSTHIKTTFYAYEDGQAGDTSKPVVLQLDMLDRVGDSAWRTLKFTKIGDLDFSGPAGFVDEFNYKFALKRFTDPHFDARQLVTDKTWHGYTTGSFNVWMDYQNVNMESVDAIVVDKATVASADKDYVNSSTLRNTSEKDFSLKTSDYSHQVTETHSLTKTWTEKTAVTYTNKMALTFAATAMFEKASFTAEITEAWNLEITHSSAETTTHTDTKTFTVSGQTILVPAGQTYRVDTAWWIANVKGRVQVLSALSNAPVGHLQLPYLNDTPPYAVTIDMHTASTVLGLSSVTSTAKVGGVDKPGTYVVNEYAFASQVGVMGEYTVTPVKVPAGLDDIPNVSVSMEVQP